MERLHEAILNEIEVEFVHGIMINVDKNKYVEYLDWKKKVQLPLEKIGTIGGEFTYSITPTSLGSIYVVTHSSGKKFDLTNYDLW